MERIARYSAQKKRASEMVKYIESFKSSDPATAKLHVNMKYCASSLLFHDYYTVDQTRLVAAKTCKKHLLCPFCAGRRAAKYVEKGISKVNEVLSQNKALKPVLITLTVKNGSSLPERFSHLKNAFRTLQKRRRDYLNVGRGFLEFAKVEGGIYAYEVTNKGQGWHPHIHIFAFLNDWVNQAQFSKEWESITGDSKIVDIRRIKPKLNAGGLGIDTAMLEVVKYSMKFSDMSLEDTWYAFTVLQSKRLLGSFGNLHGVKMPDNLLDDVLEGLPYLELLYKFNAFRGVYDLERSTRKGDEVA
jgi:plasmid rolling circle replication initiator protein Rep